MRTQIYLFDDLVEVEIDVEYEAVYQSARLYGPVEDCYPADSEMTINAWPTVSVKYFTDPFEVPLVTQELIDAEVYSCMDRINDECWQDFHDNAYERSVEKYERMEDR